MCKVSLDGCVSVPVCDVSVCECGVLHELCLRLVCVSQFSEAVLSALSLPAPAKPTPLDLRNNAVIDELPFKSPITKSWSRAM